MNRNLSIVVASVVALFLSFGFGAPALFADVVVQGVDGGFKTTYPPIKVDDGITKLRAPDGGTVAASGSSNGYLNVSIGGSSGATLDVRQWGGTFAPGLPTKINLSAGASGAWTTIPTGSAIEFNCSVDVAFRTGTAVTAATATLDDTQWPARTSRQLTLKNGDVAIAFISSSTGSCWVSIVPTAP